MIARVLTASLYGVDALPVEVEAQIFGSLRRFCLVGLPDNVLREAKDRVRCAIENSGFRFPTRELVVSLGPASLQKTGAAFDLGIALGVLAADGQLPKEALSQKLFVGELALDGRVKAVPGVLAATLLARSSGVKKIFVPRQNKAEATLVPGVEVTAVSSLAEVVAVMLGVPIPPEFQEVASPVASTGRVAGVSSFVVSFGDVIGQHTAKRALEIAAAGNHNVLLIGPPGAGKSMLAQCVPSILPPLTLEEQIEVTKIYSAVSENALGSRALIEERTNEPFCSRPFRAPHHSISAAGLIGGGSVPRPGEITLAHRGVLFLDEFPEFSRDCLESLRQPLEERRVMISRSKLQINFPCDFMLVAAMNPCPCGKSGGDNRYCECAPMAVKKYRSKISGPLLDRIDLQVWIPAVPLSELRKPPGEDPTSKMNESIAQARKAQQLRTKARLRWNAHLNARELRKFCSLDELGEKLLQQAATRFQLSARACARCLKVARTIADMEGSPSITPAHISESFTYRLQGLSG